MTSLSGVALGGLLMLALAGTWAPARQARAVEPETSGKPDMEAISKELDNPLGKLWMLFLQNDFQTRRGFPVDGAKTFNVTTFMPVLSVPIGQKLNLVNRPILPLLSAPKPRGLPGDVGQFPGEFLTEPDFGRLQSQVSTSRRFELGDVILMQALGPSKPWRGKLIYGFGPTWMFPTATDDFFGSKRASVGPTVLAVWNGPQWKVGVIGQHWWSFTDSGSKPPVSKSNIQYLLYRQLPGLWQVGMGPNVEVNWKASGDNKLTFPVGLGVNETLLVAGRLPMRVGAEVHYAAVKPDDFGLRWNFRFYVVPVVPSPFGGLAGG